MQKQNETLFPDLPEQNLQGQHIYTNKKYKKVTFKEYIQRQDYLLPSSFSDYLGKSHMAHFLSFVIDNIDLSFIVNKYKGGGASAYHPKMMLKVWLLAFLYRVYSCRLIEKMLHENLAFIWISGSQTPDFRTLNNFRLFLGNDMKKIFKEVVQMAIKAKVIEAGDVFVDHTKVEANANKHKVVWRKQVHNQLEKIDAELDSLFQHIDSLNLQEEKEATEQKEEVKFDEAEILEMIAEVNKKQKEKEMDREEAREAKKKLRRVLELQNRKESYEEKKEILDDRNSYSKTDQDAVAMMMKDGVTVRPGYNEGIAVENGIVVGYVISDNAADNVSFKELAENVIDNCEKKPENIMADGAYGNSENMSFLKENEIGNYLKYNTYNNEQSKAWREKRVRFDDFSYDANKDTYVCPNGCALNFHSTKEEVSKTGYVSHTRQYRAKESDCAACPLKGKCTEKGARTLSVNAEYNTLKGEARKNLHSKKGVELRKRRAVEVESIFGHEKMNRLKRRYHLRNLWKVKIEAGLFYCSHNIFKLYRYCMGVLPMRAKTPVFLPVSTQ